MLATVMDLLNMDILNLTQMKTKLQKNDVQSMQ